MKGVPVLLGIPEQETGILTRYPYRVREDSCTLLGLPCSCIQARNNFWSFCQIDMLTSTPPGLLLHLLYRLDLAWGKNQGWIASNAFSRSHALFQKFKTIIANEAGSYLIPIHITILSQICRNAECKNIAFYACSATWYENGANLQKLDLGS